MIERDYRELVFDIYAKGQTVEGRNGTTKSLFAKSLTIDEWEFPILTGRKIHLKGIVGELAAFLNQPKTISDFTSRGCNFWNKWAKSDGSLTVDYGNLWMDWNGHNQWAQVVHQIKTDPHSRRHIISAWKPDNLHKLDSICCHYHYQWYVRKEDSHDALDMIWTQRSVDTMIGLPSDMISAFLMNHLMSRVTNLMPGRIIMNLGDVHIYEEHLEKTKEYLRRPYFDPPAYSLAQDLGRTRPITELEFSDVELTNYRHGGSLNFELKK